MKVLNIKSKESKVLKTVKRIANSTSSKVMAVDIFDGHKRGEVIARRIIMLLALVLAIYVLLDQLVDKGYLKTNEQRQVRSVSQIVVQAPVIALEPTEGLKTNNDTPGVKQVSQFASQDLVGDVEKYVASYGGRYDAGYLASLRQYCDEETLKLVVAISVAETSMGKNTDKKTNWYGYFYKGNRSYDPSVDEMSRVICNGISKYYSDVATNAVKAKRYTGGDHTSTWMGNVQKALEQMR